MPEHGHADCPHCEGALEGNEPACPACGGALFGVAAKATLMVDDTVERGSPAIEGATEAMQSASESVADAIERTTEMIGDTVIPVFTRSGEEHDPADADVLVSAAENEQEVTLPFIEKGGGQEDSTSSSPQTEAESSAPQPDLDADSLVSRGEAMAGMGDLEAALKAFNAAIAADPGHAMAWFDRGVVLEQTGLSEDATKSFRICLTHDPEHAPAHANLATILDRVGDPAAAEHAATALRSFPGHAVLSSIAGHITESVTEEPEQLEGPVETEIEENKPEGPIVAGRPVGLVIGGGEASAPPASDEVNDQQIVEDDGFDADGLAEQASTALRAGKAQAAYDLLENALQEGASGHPRCWRVAGGCLAVLGRIDEAIDAFTESLNLDNEDPAGWFNLGMLHSRSGNIDSAATCFGAALSLDEEHSKSAHALADVRLKLGDVGGSMEAWRILLSLQPDHPDRIRYARMLVEIGEGEGTVLEMHAELPPTLPEGPVLSREATEVLEGIEGAEADLLRARAHTLRSEHADAIVIIKSHLERDKEDPETWEHLAKALIAAGENEKASKCREKVTALRGGVPTSSPVEQQPEPEQVQPSEYVEPVLESESFVETPTTEPFEPEPTVILESGLSGEFDSVAAEPASREVSMGGDGMWGNDPWGDESEESTDIDDAGAQFQDPVADHVAVEEAQGVLDVRLEDTGPVAISPDPEVDLARAALDAQSAVTSSEPMSAESSAIANSAVEWYNKGLVLLEDKRFKESLGCFEKALPDAADNDDLAIRVLNGRGHALYYMENYAECIRAYHDAMRIDKNRVTGQALYNMGTAYAEVQLYDDGIKCFKQAQKRGLSKEEKAMCKEQIRRCTELLKVQKRRAKA